MEIEHHIQRRIIEALYKKDVGSFADIRPDNIESNQFTYHLKQLIQAGFIQKLGAGKYQLSKRGLAYCDRLSESLDYKIRIQPKIITLFSIHSNKSNEVLIWQRPHQPYLNLLSHPTGKIHLGESLNEAIKREASEKLGFLPVKLEHRADIYVTILDKEEVIISQVLAHCICATIEKSDFTARNNQVRWVKRSSHKLNEFMPGFDDVETDLWTTPTFFFKEYKAPILKKG